MARMTFALEKLEFMGLNPSSLEFQLRKRVQTWQKGANLAEGCKPGRRVQTWQKGANLAEGCKPGRKVQKVQKVGIPLAPLHLLHPRWQSSQARSAAAVAGSLAKTIS